MKGVAFCLMLVVFVESTPLVFKFDQDPQKTPFDLFKNGDKDQPVMQGPFSQKDDTTCGYDVSI